MIRILPVRLDNRHDLCFSNESADVIHMPVRVIACDAALEPQYLFHAQVLAERRLDLFPRQSRIALLYRREQALFGGEQGSAPVRVDASALQHKLIGLAAVGNYCFNRLELDGFRYPRGKLIIILPVVIFCPRIKTKVDGQYGTGLTHEDGARIPCPYTIRWPAMEAHSTAMVIHGDVVHLDERTGALKHGARFLLFRCVLNNQFHSFMKRKIAHDLGNNPRNWIELTRPV